MKKGKNDKRWITVDKFIDLETGEVLGHNLPKNYAKSKIIEKTYENDGIYKYIKRTIGCRKCGEQTTIDFREYRI